MLDNRSECAHTEEKGESGDEEDQADTALSSNQFRHHIKSNTHKSTCQKMSETTVAGLPDFQGATTPSR